MNIKQMKNAISKFRSADVSIIKDEKLRAKAQKLQAKEKGFTLLELLVVITLLATLATAALVAYDGIGESASDSATANALLATESAIRNFRAVENRYPNQWDNLANVDGATTTATATAASGAIGFYAEPTLSFFGQVQVATADDTWQEIAEIMEEVGIDELQTLQSSSTFNNNAVPNLSFNESAPGNTADPADELQFDEGGIFSYDSTTPAAAALSMVPVGECSYEGTPIRFSFDGTDASGAGASTLNLINDAVDDDACTLVLALGYGKDVPGTTIDSNVAIAQVPTTGTPDVNPSENYARAIALFQVAVSEDGDIDTTDEVLDKPRLIGVVDPEGRAIDTVLAAANERAEADDD